MSKTLINTEKAPQRRKETLKLIWNMPRVRRRNWLLSSPLQGMLSFLEQKTENIGFYAL
jgi:hypothetical protein